MYGWEGVVHSPMYLYSCEVLCLLCVHSLMCLCMVVGCCVYMLFTPFVDCWEVLWLSDVGELLGVCVGGSLVGGGGVEEHKRVPMTEPPKTIATTVPTYVSIIAHIGCIFQVK